MKDVAFQFEYHEASLRRNYTCRQISCRHQTQSHQYVQNQDLQKTRCQIIVLSACQKIPLFYERAACFLSNTGEILCSDWCKEASGWIFSVRIKKQAFCLTPGAIYPKTQVLIKNRAVSQAICRYFECCALAFCSRSTSCCHRISPIRWMLRATIAGAT